MNILLVQGANLRELGTRQPHLYGSTTASELDASLLEHARDNDYNLKIVYADTEAEAINLIRLALLETLDGVIMNPGGFTDTAHELKSFLSEIRTPYIEVHITNLAKRGIVSLTAESAVGVIMGLGIRSYVIALDGMLQMLKNPA